VHADAAAVDLAGSQVYEFEPAIVVAIGRALWEVTATLRGTWLVMVFAFLVIFTSAMVAIGAAARSNVAIGISLFSMTTLFYMAIAALVAAVRRK
jgi:hypothetical protein